ncbi:MAG TPA: zinc ribbon domain-containing protein, partial [Streptosporangiaceae bacterium]
PWGAEETKQAARMLGLSTDDLLVISPTVDPFYSGRPADWRDAEWFAGLWQRFGHTTGVHLRRVHYQLLSHPEVAGPGGGQYANTEACFHQLVRAGNKARDLGLVDPLAFEDRRNDPPILNTFPRQPPEPRWEWEEPDWRLPFIGTWQIDDVELGTGKVSAHGYDYTPGDDPYLVEVWIEKSTMDDILVPLCARLRINLVRFAGFSSKTHIVQFLRRAAEVAAYGKPARIFYVSDFDPAGEAMHVAVARVAQFYLDRLAPGADIALRRVMLTSEQVDMYSLPRVPIKADDARRARFEQRNGQGAVELDALEALHPGTFHGLISEAVEPYLDHDLENRLYEADEAADDEAQEQWERQTADIQADLDAVADAVTHASRRYRQTVSEVKQQLEADLAPYREQLSQLGDRLAVRHAEAHIVLPERPAGDALGDDESDWLYASDRDWDDQLIRFHEEKGNTKAARKLLAALADSSDDDAGGCEGCGAELPAGRRADAKWCSKACRQRAERANRREERTCPSCGEVFQPDRADARFCSPACRQQWWQEQRKNERHERK